MLNEDTLVIVGGGVAGWTAAHWLRHFLPANKRIVVIDKPVISDPACISVTPAAVGFFRDQGITEADLLSLGTQFSLATHYSAEAQDVDFYLPFSATGFALQGMTFHHYAIWAKSSGLALVAASEQHKYEAYSLSAVAARLGRFRHPSEQESSIFSTLAYGYTCNAARLTAYLKQQSVARGVTCINGDLLSIDYAENGNIQCLHIASADTAGSIAVNGSLYIDASGQPAELIGQFPQSAYRDAQSILSVDSQITVACSAYIESAQSVSAVPMGWLIIRTAADLQTITLQFNKQYFSSAEVIDYLAARFSISRNDCVLTHLQPGRREFFWINNCIALGESAGYLQEFLSSQLSLIQSGLVRLLMLMPGIENLAVLAREYNRLTHLEYSCVEDFHALHYQLFSGADNNYWVQAKVNKLSEQLNYRLGVFSHTGHWPFYEGDPFLEDTWIALLLGAGHWPVSYDQRIKELDPVWIEVQLEKMYSLIQRAAIAIPVQPLPVKSSLTSSL
jgi:tryptophan 7-halogenase